MSDLNISRATTPTAITNYSVDAKSPDSAQSNETSWTNKDFTKWFGHYKTHSKIKKSIDAFATWVLGKGWNADTYAKVILDNMTGWGEDTFNSIMWNMLVMKKVAGDAYAEIIRTSKDNDRIVNLKPLNPQLMEHIVDKKGRLKEYRYHSTSEAGGYITFKPNEILHLCNDRVADEIHGVSVIEAVEWNVETAEEIKRDYRKQLHRNGVARVIEVDIDDTTKIGSFKTQWKEAIDKGDILILPKGTAESKQFSAQIQDPISFLKYLDQDFYISIGIPRVILGGSEEFTEASSKISYLTYEQIYTRETTELEADIWNQLGLKLTFNKPASIRNEMLNSEDKNTGQTSFQPKDTMITGGRE